MAIAEGAAPDQRKRVLAFAALVTGATAMGVSPIFVRLADVGPYASAFWRTFLALPFLWAWARMEDSAAPRRPRGIGIPVILAGVFFAGDLFFWHLSILATTVANATFFATTAPIWVALGAWLVLSERIGARVILGLLLCIAGGLALVGQSYSFAPWRVRGDLFGVITAIFFGLYILALRAARSDIGAARLSFQSTAVTAAILLMIAALFDSAVMPQSWSGVAALVGLAVISQVAGQGLLAVALGTLPATFSSMVIFLEAIAAATFAWAILGEALGPLQAFGGMLILAGIWMARPRPDRAQEVRP
jgi:drug/metabolite transporter (DMT)-like permease